MGEGGQREGQEGRESREMFSQNFILFSYYLPREAKIYREPNLWADCIPKIHLQLWFEKQTLSPLVTMLQGVARFPG